MLTIQYYTHILYYTIHIYYTILYTYIMGSVVEGTGWQCCPSRLWWSRCYLARAASASAWRLVCSQDAADGVGMMMMVTISRGWWWWCDDNDDRDDSKGDDDIESDGKCKYFNRKLKGWAALHAVIIHPAVHPLIYPIIYLFIHSSIYLSMYLSIYPSIYLCIMYLPKAPICLVFGALWAWAVVGTVI